jgi:dTDP-4-amino-4,6-dideoxygalactose transaminase
MKTEKGSDINSHRLLYVTRPSLPPLEEFLPLLESIWSSRILTNGGPFHQRLERALCDYLRVENLSLFTNGTIALITALKALKIKGEVITTPYSFVATAHALLWNDCYPVFADIDPVTLNLDPARIEACITNKTRAILAVHCYGQPCDVETIQAIAEKNNLPVIYDAAHAFGVTCHCGSVMSHGDLSVMSFHATKVFNTFEGGAIVAGSESGKLHIDQLKNFGFVNEISVTEVGINGKMSEMNSALGLIQLNHVKNAIRSRRDIFMHYISRLDTVAGIKCTLEKWTEGNNFSYFPILVSADYPLSRDDLYLHLRNHGVMSRRYFYPLISDMPMYKALPSAAQHNLPIAHRTSMEILCLPIYEGLQRNDVDMICELIYKASNG